MLELIDGAVGLAGQVVLGADPDQQGAADVVAPDAGLAALAAFQPGHLLAFAVQLLVFQRVVQHVVDMVELGLAIPAGVVEPVVDQPELVGPGIDVDAGHPAG